MPQLQELLSSLGTDPLNGLSSEEAQQRTRTLGAYDLHIRDLLNFDMGFGVQNPRVTATTAVYARRGRHKARAKAELAVTLSLRRALSAAKAVFTSELFPCYCGMFLSFIGWVCEPYPSTQSLNFSNFCSFCIFTPLFTMLQLSTADMQGLSPKNPRDIRVEGAAIRTADRQIARLVGGSIFASSAEATTVSSSLGGPSSHGSREGEFPALLYPRRRGASETTCSYGQADTGESLTILDDGTVLFQDTRLDVPARTALPERTSLLSGSDYIAGHYKQAGAMSGRALGAMASRSGAAPSTSASRFSSRYNFFSTNPLTCLGMAPQVSDHMRFKANVLGFLDSCFRETLAPFQAVQPDRYIVKRDGVFQVCRTNDVVEGDLVFLRVGQTAPCDLELLPHYPRLGASGLGNPGPGGSKRLSAALVDDKAAGVKAPSQTATSQVVYTMASADEPLVPVTPQATVFFPEATNYALLWEQPEVRAEFSRNVLYYLSFLDYLRHKDVRRLVNSDGTETGDSENSEGLRGVYSYSDLFLLEEENGRRRGGALRSELLDHALALTQNPNVTAEALLNLPSTVTLQPSPDGPTRNEFWVLSEVSLQRGAGVVEDLDDAVLKGPLAMESGLALSKTPGQAPMSGVPGDEHVPDEPDDEVQYSLGSFPASGDRRDTVATSNPVVPPTQGGSILPLELAKHIPGAIAAEPPEHKLSRPSPQQTVPATLSRPGKPYKARPRCNNTGYGRTHGKSSEPSKPSVPSPREEEGNGSQTLRSARLKKRIGASPSRLLCGYTVTSIANAVSVYYPGINISSLFRAFLNSCNREMATSQESADFERICMDYLSSHYFLSAFGGPGHASSPDSPDDTLRIRVCTGVFGVAVKTQTDVQILRQFSKRGERILSESFPKWGSKQAGHSKDDSRAKPPEGSAMGCRRCRRRPGRRAKSSQSAKGAGESAKRTTATASTIPATFFAHISTLQPILNLIIPLSLVSSLIMIFAPHLPNIILVPDGLDDFLALWHIPSEDASWMLVRGFIPALTASLTFSLACIVFTQKMTTILRPLLRSSSKYVKELAKKMVFLPTLGSLEALGFTNTIVVSEDMLTNNKATLKLLSVGSVSPMHYDVTEVKKLTSVFGNRALNPYSQLQNISSKNVSARYLYLLRFIMSSSLTTEELRFLLRKSGDLKNVYAGDYTLPDRVADVSELSQSQAPGSGVGRAKSALTQVYSSVQSPLALRPTSGFSAVETRSAKPNLTPGEGNTAERSSTVAQSGSSDIGHLADGDLLSGSIGVDYGVRSRQNSEVDHLHSRSAQKSTPTASLITGDAYSSGTGPRKPARGSLHTTHHGFGQLPFNRERQVIPVFPDTRDTRDSGMPSHGLQGHSQGPRNPDLTSSQEAALSCFPLRDGLNFQPIVTPSCVQEGLYGIKQFSPLITGPDILAFQTKLPDGNYLMIIRTSSIVTLSRYLGYVLVTTAKGFFPSPGRAPSAVEHHTDATRGRAPPVETAADAEGHLSDYFPSEYVSMQSRPSQGYLGDFEGTDFFDDAKSAAEAESMYSLLPPVGSEKGEWEQGKSGLSSVSHAPERYPSQVLRLHVDGGNPRLPGARGGRVPPADAQNPLAYRQITEADIRQLFATDRRMRKTCTDIIHYAICPGDDSEYGSDAQGGDSTLETRARGVDSVSGPTSALSGIGRRERGMKHDEEQLVAPAHDARRILGGRPSSVPVAYGSATPLGEKTHSPEHSTQRDRKWSPKESNALSESRMSGSTISGASVVSESMGSLHDVPALSASEEASSGEKHLVDMKSLRIPKIYRHAPAPGGQTYSGDSATDSVVSDAGRHARAPSLPVHGAPGSLLPGAEAGWPGSVARGAAVASLAEPHTPFGAPRVSSPPQQERGRSLLYQHRENYALLPGFFGQREDYRSFWEAMAAKRLVYVGSACFASEFGSGAADFVDRFRGPELGMDLVITTKRSEEEIGPLAQRLRLNVGNQGHQQRGRQGTGLAGNQSVSSLPSRPNSEGCASPKDPGSPKNQRARQPSVHPQQGQPRAQPRAQPRESMLRPRRIASATQLSGSKLAKPLRPARPEMRRAPLVRAAGSSAKAKRAMVLASNSVNTIVTSNLGTLASLILSRSRKTKTMLLIDRAVEIVQRRKRRQSVWYKLKRYLRKSLAASRKRRKGRLQKEMQAKKERHTPLWVSNNQSGAYGSTLGLPEFNSNRQNSELAQELGMEGMQEASSLTESSLFGGFSSSSPMASRSPSRPRPAQKGIGRKKAKTFGPEARPLLMAAPRSSRKARTEPGKALVRAGQAGQIVTLSAGSLGGEYSDQADEASGLGYSLPLTAAAVAGTSLTGGRDMAGTPASNGHRLVEGSMSGALILPPPRPVGERKRDRKRYVQAGHAGTGSQPADIGELPHVFIIPCSTSPAVASVLSMSGCHVTLVTRAGARNSHGIRAVDIVQANSSETSRSPDLLVVGFDPEPPGSEGGQKGPLVISDTGLPALASRALDVTQQSEVASASPPSHRRAGVAYGAPHGLGFTLRRGEVDFLRQQTGKRLSVAFVLGRYGLSRMVDACQEVPFYFRTLSPVFLGTIRSRLLIGLLPLFYTISVLVMGSLAVPVFGIQDEEISPPGKAFYFPPCAVGLLLFVTLLFVEVLLPAIIWTKPARGKGMFEKLWASFQAWRRGRAARESLEAKGASPGMGTVPPRPRKQKHCCWRSHAPSNPSSRKNRRSFFAAQKKRAQWRAWKAHENSADDEGAALLGHQLTDGEQAGPTAAPSEKKPNELPPIYIGSRAASLYQFNRALPKKTSPQGLMLTSLGFGLATLGVLLPATGFWYLPSSRGLEFLQNDYINFSPLRLSPFIMLLLVSSFTGLVSAALLVATRIPLGRLWGGIESLGQRVRKISLFISIQVVAVLVCFIAPTTFSAVSIFLLGFDVREIESDFWVAMMESACVAVIVDMVVILEQLL